MRSRKRARTPSLLPLDGQDRDVVAAGFAAPPDGQRLAELCDAPVDIDRKAGLQDGFEAVGPEQLVGRVHRLGHAVGIEVDPVAGGELDRLLPSRCRRCRSAGRTEVEDVGPMRRGRPGPRRGGRPRRRWRRRWRCRSGRRKIVRNWPGLDSQLNFWLSRSATSAGRDGLGRAGVAGRRGCGPTASPGPCRRQGPGGGDGQQGGDDAVAAHVQHVDADVARADRADVQEVAGQVFARVVRPGVIVPGRLAGSSVGRYDSWIFAAASRSRFIRS